jgi:glycosyltransferase involved in cell wall biosynthesis
MNKLTHILFLPAWYPHKEDNMYGLFTKKHADVLSKQFKISVLYFAPAQKNNFSGMQIMRSGNLFEYIYYPKHKGTNVFSKLLRFLEFIRVMQHNYKLIQDENGKPDLAHVHVLTRMGLIAYLLKKKHGLNFVITEHWSRYLNYPGTYKGLLRKIITKMVASHALEITTVTKNLADAMQNHGLKNRYSIVNNVVDTDLFRIANVNNKKTKKTFVHVSCFEDKSKNISGLLDAIHILNQQRNDFECILIGSGTDFNQMIKKAQELSLNNVVFTGLLEGKKLSETIASANFLVVSSRYENFPVVIPEAFACGLPVVATNVGGIAEWVNNSNGLLVEPDKTDKLAEAIHYMLDNYENFNPEEIRKIALNNFSTEAVLKQFIELYKRYGIG